MFPRLHRRSAPPPESPKKKISRRTGLIASGAVLALAAGGYSLFPNSTPVVAPEVADAGQNLVADGFDRSVSTGWGKPEIGGTWSKIVGGSVVSAGNSEGKVSNVLGGRSFKAYQDSISAEHVQVRADFTVPVTKDFQYTIESRKQPNGSSYYGRARIDPKGKLHIDIIRNDAGAQTTLKEMTLDTEVPVGRKLVLKLATVGNSPVIVQGKVFVLDSPEPGWQVTALDSAATAIKGAGYTGLMVYNGGGNPAVNLATQAFIVAETDPPSVTAENDSAAAQQAAAMRLDTKHGAGAVGSADYPVPANALFVAPSGNDTNPGTQAQPFKTLNKALTKNWSGQTIVLRGGTYHESVLVAPGRAATIQPYPREAVWFDGTREVSDFKASGSTYVAGWDVDLDSSPTYTKGAPDGTAAGWQFVNPDQPMAAHPDMVWIGDVEQKQVKSLSLVKAGTFYVDKAGDKLHLGTNPAGKTVRSSDLQMAFSLRAPGTVLRGFGIRRYAGSVWQQGVITSYYERQTLDNMTVLDSATAGIGFFKKDSVIKNTTVSGSGQMGIHVSRADNLIMDNVSVTDSNDELFNPAPSAGGIKVTQTRTVVLRNSEILRTYGNQFWTDQSTYNVTLADNEILNGQRWGVVLEISSTAGVVNNIIADNAYDGIAVQNTDKVSIWNNTIVNNRRAIALTQDSRRIEQLQVDGHDDRRPQPDPQMPWVIGNSSIGNNVLSAGNGAKSVLAVESYELAFDASKLKITTNGNIYAQKALGSPDSVVTWARKDAQPYQFVLLDDYSENTGQAKISTSVLTPNAVDGAYQVKKVIADKRDAVALPLPTDVANRAGRDAGEKHLGAWSRPTK